MRARYERTLDYRKSYLDNLRKLRFVLPTLTYESRLVLNGGGREVRLLHERAHTRGDTVVYLPKEKILFTGDLLDDLPYVGHGYPSEWIQTLRALATLDVDRIVPGHGRPYEGKDRLTLVADFLESIVIQVRAGLAAGRGENDIREAVDVEPFRARVAGTDPLASRTFDEFVPEAIDRAFQEATGKPTESAPDSQ
jgi:glyoxylase-like metal-dependent hydrolase (beta-lactamase superfamily II)